MQLGVGYPGSVQSGRYHYYSIYIDPLLNTTNSTSSLDLELYSVSGDADLYCSDVSTQPVQLASRWSSSLTGREDRILIPLVDLQADTIYCGVFGFGLSAYVFSALYNGGPATELGAGETAMVQSALGNTQQYSLVFPATAYVVSLSIVSEVGTTSIKMSTSSGRLVAVSGQAAVQTQQVYASALCGLNNELAIPGTSPPLCQLLISVYTPSGGVYSITATSASGQLVALTAGEPMKWEVSAEQPAFFSFTIPDELSNMTMIVTVTNGGSGLLLQAGIVNYASLETRLTVSQLPGDNVLVFQLDWTDSQLDRSSRLAGTYGLTLSATSGPVTFSIVYTVANSSAYSSSIVRLLDGQPQESVVAVRSWQFYFIQLPTAGWPYVVTVNIQWLSGSGTTRVVAAYDGPFVGPLPNAQLLRQTTGSQIAINPGAVGWFCDPTARRGCGYAISVQSDSQLQQPSVYIITVTSTRWIRFLYINQVPSDNILVAGGEDYWLSTTTQLGGAVDPLLLYALTVSSGSVTVYASNTTAALNASNSQQTWTASSSTAVLSFPLPLGRTSMYLTVVCSSLDDTPCEYTLLAQTYSEGAAGTQSSLLSESPVAVLLPPGGISWVLYTLQGRGYAAIGYLLLQAEAAVGSVALYAVCVSSSAVIYRVLPNETYYSWRAVSSPVLIEITNFNISAVECSGHLILGVRSTSDQPTLAHVIASAAGVEQQILNQYRLAGLIAPTHPVSYYHYQMTDDDPSVVVSFTLSSGNCTVDQLSMVVSDSTTYSNSSVPSSYNFSATPATLLPSKSTVVITNYTKPSGSLHVGEYHVAVGSRAAALTCQYFLQTSQSRIALLSEGVELYHMASERPISYFQFTPSSNTSTSFSLQMRPGSDVLYLVVGINSAISLADPSTYLMVATYNTTGLVGDVNSWAYMQPLLVPAAACSSYTAVGETCTIVVLAVARTESMRGAYVMPTTSANAVWLREANQPIMPPNATVPNTTYQFALDAAPQTVTVNVSSSAFFNLSCSYQYVAPNRKFYDWRTQRSSSTAINMTQLAFDWGPQLQINPTSTNAATPTTCYCTVQSSGPYTIFYTTISVHSPSSASDAGLSSGALAAAVVVPIVAVLVLVVVVLWLRRGRQWCSHSDSNKTQLRGHQRLDDSSAVSNEVSLADLSGTQRTCGRLMNGGGRGDRA